MNADQQLQQLRAEMDTVNQRLVLVLHERARLCRAIGAWKRAHQVAAVDPEREQTMLAALLRDLPEHGFSHDALAAVLREVFAASRALVERS